MAGDGQAAEAVFVELRERVLNLDPATAGMHPTAEHPTVWGVMVETGLSRGTATLVSLVDGTTSLYLSNGGGVIGGGSHATVAAAVGVLLRSAEANLQFLDRARSIDLPVEGWVTIRVLTHAGDRTASIPERDLRGGRHELSEVFHAGQKVITRLRRISEGISR